MFTSLSAEIITAKILRELGISIAVISKVVGIEKTKLSYALRPSPLRELPNHEATLLKITALRLQEIARAIRPFTLDVKDAESLQMMLKTFEGMDEHVIAVRVRVVFQGDGYDQ